MSAELARRAYWENPDDKAALAVWADALTDSGDPRGELIHLHLAAGDPIEIGKRERTLGREHGGRLVGAARPFLRKWYFGPAGLVVHATCEAKLLIEGFSEIEKLNPRLFLAITALKPSAIVCAVGALSLGSIFFVDLTRSTGITDKTLTTLAPAFRRVRHLALPLSAAKSFTPAGLAYLAEHLEAIEYLLVDHLPRPEIAPADEYMKVIATARGFSTLASVQFAGASVRPPQVVSFNAGSPTTMYVGMYETLKKIKRGA